MASSSKDDKATPNASEADSVRKETKFGSSGRRKHTVRKSERRQSTAAGLQAEELAKHGVTNLKDAAGLGLLASTANGSDEQPSDRKSAGTRSRGGGSSKKSRAGVKTAGYYVQDVPDSHPTEMSGSLFCEQGGAASGHWIERHYELSDGMLRDKSPDATETAMEVAGATVLNTQTPRRISCFRFHAGDVELILGGNLDVVKQWVLALKKAGATTYYKLPQLDRLPGDARWDTTVPQKSDFDALRAENDRIRKDNILQRSLVANLGRVGQKKSGWSLGQWVEDLHLHTLLAATLQHAAMGELHIEDSADRTRKEHAFIKQLGESGGVQRVRSLLHEGKIIDTLAELIHASAVKLADEEEKHHRFGESQMTEAELFRKTVREGAFTSALRAFETAPKKLQHLQAGHEDSMEVHELESRAKSELIQSRRLSTSYQNANRAGSVASALSKLGDHAKSEQLLRRSLDAFGGVSALGKAGDAKLSGREGGLKLAAELAKKNVLAKQARQVSEAVTSPTKGSGASASSDLQHDPTEVAEAEKLMSDLMNGMSGGAATPAAGSTGVDSAVKSPPLTAPGKQQRSSVNPLHTPSSLIRQQTLRRQESVRSGQGELERSKTFSIDDFLKAQAAGSSTTSSTHPSLSQKQSIAAFFKGLPSLEPHHVEIKALLEAGDYEIGHQNELGCDALFLAAGEGDAGLVQLLLAAGANPDTADPEGETCLIRSVTEGHEDVAGLLLEKGADANRADDDGITALFCCCRAVVLEEHHEQLAKLLLKHKADPNLPTHNGVTCLLSACRNRHDRLVKLLLRGGASTDVPGDGGTTALLACCHKGDYEMAQLLLEHGASIDLSRADGVSPLMMACQDGHEDMAELLIERKATLDHADESGLTALMASCSNNQDTVAKLLLDAKASPDLARKDGTTSLMFCCQEGFEDVAQLLIQRGANMDLAMADGTTALMLACENGFTTITRTLLEKGANPNLADEKGTTSLMHCCEQGFLELVEMLIEHGASVHKQDKNGLTALMLSYHHEFEAIASVLRDHGATVDVEVSQTL